MVKWQVARLKDYAFDTEYSNLKKSDSQDLIHDFIRDIVNVEHPCKMDNAEPCDNADNVLPGTCIIVFPNSSLKLVIYPNYGASTVYFISCRD